MWNDPEIGIDWPVTDPILSARDRPTRRSAPSASERPGLQPRRAESRGYNRAA